MARHTQLPASLYEVPVPYFALPYRLFPVVPESSACLNETQWEALSHPITPHILIPLSIKKNHLGSLPAKDGWG